MKKSLIIFLLFILTKSVWSQEQISNFKYDFVEKGNSYVNILTKDSVINGFIYTENSGSSPTKINYFNYETNKISVLDFHLIKDSLRLNSYDIIGIDSISFIFQDNQSNYYWIDSHLPTGKSKLLKYLPRTYENQSVYYNFYKNGLAYYENMSIKYLERNVDSVKILSEFSKEAGEDVVLQGGGNYSPYFRITKNFYFVKFRTNNIIINGKKTKIPLNTHHYYNSNNRIIFYSTEKILEFKISNDQIKEDIIFEGQNISTFGNYFIASTNGRTTYFQLDIKKIKVIEKPIFTFQYGEEIHTTNAKIKLGYSPFTGGAFYNYVWVVDKRDNSYFDITNLSSFITLTGNNNPTIKSTEKMTLIHTISAYNEGFLLIDSKSKNLEFRSLKVLKILNNSNYLVLDDKGLISFFNADTFSFQVLKNLSTSYENHIPQHLVGPSNGILIKIGDKVITSSYLSTPIKFNYSIEKNNEKKVINRYQFSPLKLAKDTILTMRFDKKYAFSENTYSDNNNYTFQGRNFDSLFFYNNNTKNIDFLLLNTKSNENSMEFNYFANDEIHIKIGTNLIVKNKNMVKTFKLPEINYSTKGYDTKLKILYYIFRTSETSYKVVSIKNGKFTDFHFESEDTNTPKIINGRILIKNDKKDYILDLQSQKLLPVHNKNLFILQHLTNFEDFEVYYKKDGGFYSAGVLVVENIKTNRTASITFGREETFYFCWAENENLYFNIHSLSKSPKFYRFNLKTFKLSYLDEDIIFTNTNDLSVTILKGKEYFKVSFAENPFCLNYTIFYGPSTQTLEFTKNPKTLKYYLYSSLNQAAPQLFEFNHDQETYRKLKWVTEKSIDNSELLKKEIFNINLFPNPVNNNYVYLDLKQNISNIEIFNQYGFILLSESIVYSEHSSVYNNKYKPELILRSFLESNSMGIYTIRFTFEDNTTEVKKLIKL